MDGASLTPEQEKLNALKQVLPEVFAEGKVDWEKLKATLGEDINFSNERYVLNWAGKSEAFKVLQAPTTKTLVPAKDESVNFDDTEHIFIEGENLEVLKVLQKSYFGKVKMIYIDPPYNTGADHFIYPDKFSETKDEYEKRVGDKDEEGYMTKDGMFKKNSKENGQYHSNWLNMMMPRLYLAKNLLKQDGVIFVSIDDNEVHNLRLLMNEIFGEENFVGCIMWNSTKSVTNTALISVSHNYNLIYAKSLDYFIKNRNEFRLPDDGEGFANPDNDPRGKWKADPFQVGGWRPNQQYEIVNPVTGEKYFPNKGCSWKNDFKKFKELLNDNRIVFGKTGEAGPQRKRFLYEALERGKVSKTWWDEVGTTTNGTQLVKKLFEGNNFFTNPKPIDLIQKMIQLGDYTNRGIILDFFSGSGTTAHAVMALNAEDGGKRKCVSVQLAEKCDEKSEAYKAGYKNIADIAKDRIRRAGKKINEDLGLMISDLESKIKKLESELPTEETKAEIENLKTKIKELTNQDLGFKVLKLSDSNFKQWQQITGKDKEALEVQMKLFVDPVAKNATTENMVYELLLKSGKDLNSTIEKNDGYFLINGNEMALILEKVSQEIITEVMSEYPKKVIALDKLFKGNDQLKTNTVLQMKDAGIEFKTI
jgi:adenine-specific DNA-methyltransferase